MERLLSLNLKCLSLELFPKRLHGFNVDGMEDLKDRQDDRQSNRGFGRSEHDDKNGVDLAIYIAAAEMREGDIIDVGAIQYEFDSHQNADRIAPGKNRKEAESEKDGADNEIGRELVG